MNGTLRHRTAPFISAIAPKDFDVLRPHLVNVSFARNQKLNVGPPASQQAYFIVEGVMSVQAKSKNGSLATEMAMVGSEGLIGSAAALGFIGSSSAVVVQINGSGQSIAIHKLRRAMEESESLLKSIMHFYSTLLAQAGQSALSGACGTTEQRLAKWLLMVQDRIHGSELVFSHQAIANLLSTRRPAISIALARFHRDGLLKVSPGRKISIQNRCALEKIAENFYGASELEYDKHFAH